MASDYLFRTYDGRGRLTGETWETRQTAINRGKRARVAGVKFRLDRLNNDAKLIPCDHIVYEVDPHIEI